MPPLSRRCTSAAAAPATEPLAGADRVPSRGWSGPSPAPLGTAHLVGRSCGVFERSLLETERALRGRGAFSQAFRWVRSGPGGREGRCLSHHPCWPPGRWLGSLDATASPAGGGLSLVRQATPRGDLSGGFNPPCAGLSPAIVAADRGRQRILQLDVHPARSPSSGACPRLEPRSGAACPAAPAYAGLGLPDRPPSLGFRPVAPRAGRASSRQPGAALACSTWGLRLPPGAFPTTPTGLFWSLWSAGSRRSAT
jgi:hypothetical protein